MQKQQSLNLFLQLHKIMVLFYHLLEIMLLLLQLLKIVLQEYNNSTSWIWYCKSKWVGYCRIFYKLMKSIVLGFEYMTMMPELLIYKFLQLDQIEHQKLRYLIALYTLEQALLNLLIN
ncbi:unnamed protein product [Paramecium sonneborni]|uniref:Transmembrane protein n=1 Tax=Paramecium sonneborni TaxID=65129 RepID=A0A8S1RCJ6_9CILI|nr:unnamed protein product [Paramecium sonneborni]